MPNKVTLNLNGYERYIKMVNEMTNGRGAYDLAQNIQAHAWGRMKRVFEASKGKHYRERNPKNQQLETLLGSAPPRPVRTGKNSYIITPSHRMEELLKLKHLGAQESGTTGMVDKQPFAIRRDLRGRFQGLANIKKSAAGEISMGARDKLGRFTAGHSYSRQIKVLRVKHNPLSGRGFLKAYHHAVKYEADAIVTAWWEHYKAKYGLSNLKLPADFSAGGMRSLF